MNLPEEKFVPKKPSKYDQLLKQLNDLIADWRGQIVNEVTWNCAADELKATIDKVINE